MNSYEFQILRYCNDLQSGEFINLGILLYEPSSRQLIFNYPSKLKRFTSFFPNVKRKTLFSILHSANIKVRELQEMLLSQLDFKGLDTIERISSLIVQPNNSTLFFSRIYRGCTLNRDYTARELYDSIISKYLPYEERISRNDEDARKIIYKEYFEKYGISKKLTLTKVPTQNDEFDFEGWKNGVWHFYKPISFDLLDVDSIKDKAYRYWGIANELKTSTIPFKLYFLSLNPTVDKDLKIFIKKKLELEDNLHKVEVIEEENFETFSLQLSSMIKG